MNRRAAMTKAEIARIIRAAKQEGAAEVEVRAGDTAVVIKIKPSTGDEAALVPGKEIVL